MTLKRGRLLKETRKSEQFFPEKFPPLDGIMDDPVEKAVLLYMESDMPYGFSPDIREMQDKALLWLEEFVCGESTYDKS